MVGRAWTGHTDPGSAVPFPGHELDLQHVINFSVYLLLNGISSGPDRRASIANVVT
ncbi:hypothetical protein BN2476_210159 [Paraburkholderia piptadeniae]|uniref:Uncharacterized protein n=1 Tax=Paraburkholderia piptadeniae TaxID=1701573 RepID=A0A1N7RW72_9BURK|nr:hypothetical protein BN2476_210159 [Paraburkholderia piptadeniae]